MNKAENSEGYYDLVVLRDRGWTRRLVKKFLGEPDGLHRIDGAQSGRLQNLYCAKRVASIETTDSAFIEEKKRTEL